MADPKSRFLKFASKAVPTAFLGGIGLVLAGNLLDNAYRRFVQTPEELAEKIRSGDHKPNVFLDIRSGKKDLGRVEIELDYENTPLTSENFRELCTHQTGIGYRGSIFHRIVPGFLCQGGDIDRQDGTGGRSIYGATFDDESFDGWKHSGPGMVGMANKGPNTNNSQFYILTSEKPAPWLDGEHVVFGRVVKGMEVVHAIEADRADEGSELHQALLEKAKLEPVGDTERQIHPAPRTLSSFTIVDCGEVVDNKVAAPETMAEVAAATTTV